jgi:hypothetical protein
MTKRKTTTKPPAAILPTKAKPNKSRKQPKKGKTK